MPFAEPLDLATLGRDFRQRHREIYGYATEEHWEMQSLRLRALVARRTTLGPLAGAERHAASRPASRLLVRARGAAPTRRATTATCCRPARRSPGRRSSRTPGRPSSCRPATSSAPTRWAISGSGKQGMKNAIDPFTVEVIRHALTAAAEEMSFVVMRSARSPLLREAGDLSSAITDHKGDLIAQGRDIPIHLGVMSFTVKKFLERVPAERLQPGDVWFLNLPEVGGNHLPDVKAIRPIFLEGRLFAFAVSLAHWGDIGGAWAGSYFAAATETWQEGVRIPPLRLFTADGIDEEKRDFLLANLRGPAEREGDLLAQMASTRAAEGRLPRSARSMAPPPSAPRSTGWTISPRRRCARRSPACPTASTRARTSSTTTGRAASPPPSACEVEIAGDHAQLRLQRHRRCRRRPAQHHAVRGHGRGLLRHQGGGRPGDPAQWRLLSRRSRSARGRARSSIPASTSRWSAATTRPRSAPSTPSCGPSSRRCPSG